MRPPARRPIPRLLVAVTILAAAACWSAGPFTSPDVGTVTLRMHLSLRGETSDIGTTRAGVYVYAARGSGSTDTATTATCSLAHTPETVCEITVPRGSQVLMLAVENEPSLRADFAPVQPSDTAPTTRFIEFRAWNGCPNLPDRGSCAYVARQDTTIDAVFKYMLQVVVDQIGAVGLGFTTQVPSASLTIPRQTTNILNLVGCSDPCDSVRAVGATPWHRLTVMLPMYGSLVLTARNGADTQFQGWSEACGPYVGLCSYDIFTHTASIVPYLGGDSLRTRLVVTLKYDFWQCPSGPSDHDSGGCTRVTP